LGSFDLLLVGPDLSQELALPHRDAVDKALHIDMPVLPCADLFALKLIILE
jgi:hypothetical protein